MKATLRIVLALFLAAAVLVPFASCDSEKTDATTTAATTPKAVTNTTTTTKATTTGTKEPEPTPSKYDVLSGDEKQAQSDYTDTFVYWADQNWCGSTVTFDQAESDGETYTFAFSHSGACWYGAQIFFNPSTASNGEAYTVSFKIKSDVDTTITVCKNIVELKANEEKTVTYDVELNMLPDATDYNYGQSLFSMQFGVEENTVDIVDGTYIITDFTFALKAA